MPTRARWKREIFLLAIFLLLGVVVFSSVIRSWFLSDDFALIERVALEGYFSTWGESPGGFYRPVTVLSYVINHAMFGFAPLGYHLTNVIFHSLSAFLVYLFCRALAGLTLARPKEAQPVAIVSGLLFLCLPSHSESVSWIAGRTDVIATFFALTALVSFCSYLRGKPWYLLGLGVAALALALFTKESALPIPFILLILGTVFLLRSATRRRDAPRAVLAVASSFLVLAAYFVFRYQALGVWIGGYGTEAHLSFAPEVILEHFGRDLLRMFIPALPPYSQHLLATSQAYLVYGLCLLLGLLVAYALVRARSRIKEQVMFGLVALCCLVCALIPAITMYIDIYSTEGERFLYVPSVFGVMLAGYLLHLLLPRQRLYAAASILLIVAYALVLWRVNARWVTAGELSKNLAQTVVQSASSDRIVVLNLPDNFRGAYVYRNGFVAAISTFLDKPRPSLRTASAHDVMSLGDEVVLRSEEDGTLTLELSSPEARFKWIEQHAGVSVQLEGPRTASLDLALEPLCCDIFWFTKGQFQRYSESPTPCTPGSACFRAHLPFIVR